VAFAVLALTLVRMVPVALALLGTRLDRGTVALLGWFGPRGLASVVFGLLAFDTLPTDEGRQVITAIAATVLLSVVLHGASAAPLGRRFARTHPTGAGTAADAEP
jgi:NhaP-type Na+/H+ or K+/H+ antiporter